MNTPRGNFVATDRLGCYKWANVTQLNVAGAGISCSEGMGAFTTEALREFVQEEFNTENILKKLILL